MADSRHITRRLFMRHGAAAGAALSTTAFATKTAQAAEDPVQRVNRARRELIEATKAAYPDVSDWRFLTPDSKECGDNDRSVGLFMLIGHKRR